MTNIIILILLIALGYYAGHHAEKKHYQSIKKREEEFLNLPAVTFSEKMTPIENVASSTLVYGSAVISIDYFKRILAALRNIFGGEVGAYESLLDRARREAVLRMKSMATNANCIVNVRIETASIGKSANRKNSLGSVEAIAYGTALSFKEA